MKKIIKSTTDMIDFGAKLGAELRGGEVIELIGDVGAGKTTFTKGLAKGLAIAETVQSPSFTISRVYDGRLELVHYDFYRLNNAGVMALELADNLSDAEKVVVIEWAETVADILPKERIRIKISSPSETERVLEVENWQGGAL
ncbi:tRNA (adenosine(37)-N6)-threonylcarbamoyltransferase complex ATPase subunit type 1 TsaE [Candidatus Saccharibacteria bacterium]|nr:tRNA (adenosine(37)-N6)-threonylcarbamoyltransferase complex ATPase subunit type 1 TsaE [Candidatus Saccharibacteria bacterium]NCU43580.1 tRNA (adenosine(37)-N6)-threonylcarbamoyltransferase complex ATPase subunit type 1 TsaE [Candidatus Saccharibacteria bacterium]